MTDMPSCSAFAALAEAHTLAKTQRCSNIKDNTSTFKNAMHIHAALQPLLQVPLT